VIEHDKRLDAFYTGVAGALVAGEGNGCSDVSCCFDSGITTQALLLVGMILAYPLFPLVWALLYWRYYRNDNRSVATAGTSLSFVIVVAGGTAIQSHG
jgi:hypothetical protein